MVGKAGFSPGPFTTFSSLPTLTCAGGFTPYRGTWDSGSLGLGWRRLCFETANAVEPAGVEESQLSDDFSPGGPTSRIKEIKLGNWDFLVEAIQAGSVSF